MARLLAIICLVYCSIAAAAAEPGLPEWAAKIRTDHPRLFFNRDTWPAVRERALGPEKEWYEQYKRRVDQLQEEIDKLADPPRDRGPQAAWAAFVYRMTGERPYLDLAKKAMEISLRFYEKCYEERKAVNWYSTTRVHVVLAWDWLYNDLTEAERKEYLSRLVQVLHKVYTARPRIYRESLSNYTTGFYGVTNCKWFVGLAGLGSGSRMHSFASGWCVDYGENMKMLAHRKRACGDDGGSASPTLGYAFGAYPWSGRTSSTWLSATGENILGWPHSAWLTTFWNWIETGAPRASSVGGYAAHRNRMPYSDLYTHMANIRHLWQGRPGGRRARALRAEKVPQRYQGTWFIYLPAHGSR